MNNKYIDKIITIPNILSLVRILMIPVVILFYIVFKNITAAALLLAAACLTDAVDGYIARRYNMISNVGKALDAIADKLLQFSILVCVAANYWQTYILASIFVVKEITTTVFCLRYVKASGHIDGARWYGKVCTVILDIIMLLMFFYTELNAAVVWTLTFISAIALVFTFAMYVSNYFKATKKILKNDVATSDVQ